MVDGVHFRSALMSAEEIGWRALAAALSDLAAMGTPPGGEAYVALGLPAGTQTSTTGSRSSQVPSSWPGRAE